ncbi:hypothetical protein [Agrobacterium tumefaciens]|uniref:hypothetical protein n=1 Tax=Agrobacterium tumefaciens TaxID=358 RepID=UPI0030136209
MIRSRFPATVIRSPVHLQRDGCQLLRDKLDAPMGDGMTACLLNVGTGLPARTKEFT